MKLFTHFRFTLCVSLIIISTAQKTVLSNTHQGKSANSVYIPLTIHPMSTQTRINDIRFGVGLKSYDTESHITSIESAGAGWLYSNELAIRWSDFEPNRAGEYEPTNVNAGGDNMRKIEQQILNANARKFRIIQ